MEEVTRKKEKDASLPEKNKKVEVPRERQGKATSRAQGDKGRGKGAGRSGGGGARQKKTSLLEVLMADSPGEEEDVPQSVNPAADAEDPVAEAPAEPSDPPHRADAEAALQAPVAEAQAEPSDIPRQADDEASQLQDSLLQDKLGAAEESAGAVKEPERKKAKKQKSETSKSSENKVAVEKPEGQLSSEARSELESSVQNSERPAGEVTPADAGKEEDLAAEDVEDEAAPGEGEPGALVLPLEAGAAALLLERGGRWARHLESVMDAEVEVFAADAAGDRLQVPGLEGIIENQDDETPRQLEIVTPNGQRECAGCYHLLRSQNANGQPIWQKEDGKRWIYSGTDGSWLVGGAKQKELEFACRTGLLHLAKPHGGKPPQRLPPRGWKRVHGKQWVEDADIAIKAPLPLAGGTPVLVHGLRRLPKRKLNGRYGCLLSRRQETDGCVWRTRLADGTEEEIHEDNLQPRQVVSGEAWLRVRGQCSGSVAARAATALAFALLGRPAEEHLLGNTEMESFADAATVVDIPKELMEHLQREDLQNLMEKHSVILSFLQRKEVSGEDKQSLRLAVFGQVEKKAAALLGLLVLGEEVLPGHFKSAPPSDSADSSHSAIGFSTVSCLPTGGEAALDTLLPLVALAMEVQIAHVGLVVFIVGASMQRLRAVETLNLVQSSVPEVPPLLEPLCARTRVPAAATKEIKKQLDGLQKELSVFFVWSNQSKPAKADTARDAFTADEELRVGAAVQAEYDGEWHNAMLLELDLFEGTAQVRWDYDSSTSDVPVQAVKPKLTPEVKKRRQRQAWLDTAQRLAIFGRLRDRKIAVTRVMAMVEEQCPGLWTSELVDAAEELRGSVGEESSFDVQVCSLTGAGSLQLLPALQKGLKDAAKRVSAASGCCMQLLRRSALLAAGSREQRSRGLDYLQWLAAEKTLASGRSSSSSAPASGASKEDSAVRWIDADGDQLLLRVNGRGGLDFYINGDRKIRDLGSMKAEGKTLRMSGMSCGSGSASRTADVPPSQEAVIERALALFAARHSSSSTAISAEGRSDVATVEATCAQAAWLEPTGLRMIELQTRTLVLFGDSLGDDEDWQPLALCRIHVCGVDDSQRQAAFQGVKKLVDALPRDVGETAPAAATAAAPSSGSQRTQEREEAPAAAAAEASIPKAPVVPPSTLARVEPAEEVDEGPSNPLDQLRALCMWPKDNEDWKKIQDEVWRGHPPLKQGWIRVWSRSKDCEYYVRMKDGKATFEFREAAA
eukprot:TRINITY_DN14654_c0_g1_i1.p1 TRINITY_DN14654_c0_g1~~TRINITY_DN14654_c0_g1_i1.p1  ORF type:complete len:1398 (+),score=366.42 TRINITY_DN14654_c0_g1_i1:459-4196(+)